MKGSGFLILRKLSVCPPDPGILILHNELLQVKESPAPDPPPPPLIRDYDLPYLHF